MKRPRFVLEATLIAVLGVAVLGSTLALTKRNDLAFFDPIIDVKALLDARFVKEVDEKELQAGAIRGMLEVLEDPYTLYVPGKQRDDFEKQLTGEYVGIGAQITIREGWLTVVTPLDDSPAFRAGVMADDKIVQIEGESTENITSDGAVDLLTGEPGTVVHVMVERDGVELALEITRAAIKTRSVKGVVRGEEEADRWRYLLDEERGIAYLRLTQFTPASSREVRQALEEMGADTGAIKGLVFDMRWNPGGVLDDAIRMADFFLDEGVIVSTNGRGYDERITRATKRGTLPEFPIVLMVNDTSASASEVLAGALSENDRAIVLGTRSFGKGSVQSVYNLPSSTDGSELKMTEQLYYLPSGRSIHRMNDSAVWGVDPTAGFYVPIDNQEEFDLFEVRREQEIIREDREPADVRWEDPEWIENEMKDKQLARALEAVQLRIDRGEWIPTGQEGIAGKELAGEELQNLRFRQERLIRELQRIGRQEDALVLAAGDLADEDETDLWDDSIDLAGGEMVIRDAEGNEVSRLRITGNRLERWLMDADIEKIPSN